MNKIKKRMVVGLILVIALVVSACSPASDKAVNNNKTNNAEEAAQELKLTHKLGETIINKNPQKVVVFDYGVLDALDKMGVEVTAVPKGTSIPDSLKKYNDEKYLGVGSLKEPDLEKIFEVKPDLIIISGRQSSYYEELKKIAPTLYIEIADEDYMGSFKNNMNTLGKIFGKEDFVEKEIKALDEKVAALKEKAAATGKNALIILANDGSLSAYGEASRFGVIHNAFGFTPIDKNIEVSTHGQSVSFEYIVEKNPDYLFVIDRAAIAGGSKNAKQVLENDLMKTTKAFKENKIVYLDPATWYVSTGGFNSTLKMVEEVEAAIK